MSDTVQPMPKVSITTTINDAIAAYREIVGKSLSEDAIVNEAIKAGLKAMARTLRESVLRNMAKGLINRKAIGATDEALIRYQNGELAKAATLATFAETLG